MIALKPAAKLDPPGALGHSCHVRGYAELIVCFVAMIELAHVGDQQVDLTCAGLRCREAGDQLSVSESLEKTALRIVRLRCCLFWRPPHNKRIWTLVARHSSEAYHVSVIGKSSLFQLQIRSKTSATGDRRFIFTSDRLSCRLPERPCDYDRCALQSECAVQKTQAAHHNFHGRSYL